MQRNYQACRSRCRFSILSPLDLETEIREAAAKVAERKVIRAGRDAWEAINKAESFEGWAVIGKALTIGRDYALRATGANAPTGRRYTWAFSAWCKRNGFGTMKPATRSWCLALHENRAAITAWRDGLPTGRGRRPPVNPQSCVKGWQRSQANGNGHAAHDWRREAISAWQRFCFCVPALSESEAQAMWAMVRASNAAAA
jgi:hypothetical protein